MSQIIVDRSQFSRITLCGGVLTNDYLVPLSAKNNLRANLHFLQAIEKYQAITGQDTDSHPDCTNPLWTDDKWSGESSKICEFIVVRDSSFSSIDYFSAPSIVLDPQPTPVYVFAS